MFRRYTGCRCPRRCTETSHIVQIHNIQCENAINNITLPSTVHKKRSPSIGAHRAVPERSQDCRSSRVLSPGEQRTPTNGTVPIPNRWFRRITLRQGSRTNEKRWVGLGSSSLPVRLDPTRIRAPGRTPNHLTRSASGTSGRRSKQSGAFSRSYSAHESISADLTLRASTEKPLRRAERLTFRTTKVRNRNETPATCPSARNNARDTQHYNNCTRTPLDHTRDR